MPGVTRSRRAISFLAFGWVGMLLGLTGLAAVGLDRISCGHQHLVSGHSFYHHHLFFAAHEHHDAADHPRRKPDPRHPKAPHKPATVAPAPALFQPVSAGVVLAVLAISTPVAPAHVLPGVAQPAIQPTRPRGPPAAIAPPGTGREKGNTGCWT